LETLLEEKRKFVNEIGRNTGDKHQVNRHKGKMDKIIEENYGLTNSPSHNNEYVGIPKKYRKSLKKLTLLNE
jgi:hypothetical protein